MCSYKSTYICDYMKGMKNKFEIKADYQYCHILMLMDI